jgi:hypothetical protein
MNENTYNTEGACTRREAYVGQRVSRRVLRVSGTGVSHLLVGMARVGGAHDVRVARGGYERGQVQIVPPASRLSLFALAPRCVVIRPPGYAAAIHHHPPPSRVTAGAGCAVATRCEPDCSGHVDRKGPRPVFSVVRVIRCRRSDGHASAHDTWWAKVGLVRAAKGEDRRGGGPMRSRGGVTTAGLPFGAICGGAARVPRVARVVTMLMARLVVSAEVVVRHDLRRLEVLRYCRVHQHHGHQRRQPVSARRRHHPRSPLYPTLRLQA